MTKEFLPCPFCGSSDINAFDGDDDSFMKTIIAECDCGCKMEIKFDWRPFSVNRDIVGFDAAWKDAIMDKWNTRLQRPLQNIAVKKT